MEDKNSHLPTRVKSHSSSTTTKQLTNTVIFEKLFLFWVEISVFQTGAVACGDAPPTICNPEHSISQAREQASRKLSKGGVHCKTLQLLAPYSGKSPSAFPVKSGEETQDNYWWSKIGRRVLLDKLDSLKWWSSTQPLNTAFSTLPWQAGIMRQEEWFIQSFY